MKKAMLGFAITFTLGYAAAQNSPQATEAAIKHRAEKSGNSSTAPVVDTSQTNAPKASPVQSQATLAQQLEACKSDAKWNVYKRERCVWKLCNGRWDKDGCPPQGGANATTKP